MKIFDLVRLILGNLSRRKARVALTAIGVVIGTAAVVILVSLAIGLQRNANEQLFGIGDLTQIQVMPAAQVCFNYLGQFDHTLPEGGLFAVATESAGRSHDGRDRLGHELTFAGAIIGGRFEVSLTYSRERYRQKTIEAVAGYQEAAEWQ